MKQVHGTSLLVTIAEDLPNEPVLRVWALDKIEKDGAPKCLSTLGIHNGRKPFPVSLLLEMVLAGADVYRYQPSLRSRTCRNWPWVLPMARSQWSGGI